MITVDVSNLTSKQAFRAIHVIKEATRICNAYHLTPLTSFVLASLALRSESVFMNIGFIKAVDNYVWKGDASHLTEALRKKCDNALEQACQNNLILKA